MYVKGYILVAGLEVIFIFYLSVLSRFTTTIIITLINIILLEYTPSKT